MNKPNSQDLSNSEQNNDSDKIDKSNNDLLKRKNLKTLRSKRVNNSENTIRILRGKWDKEEHDRFLEICIKHGNNWPKIQEILQTRTCAQIRSHAQKFIIKLCKKYQIKIKSKKFRSKDSKHLNFVYKKKIVNPRPVEPEDQRFLDLFNYYKREQKIFFIEKIHKNPDSTNCPLILRKLVRHDLSNKNNPIWKINKTSNEDSNLLYIPNQTIIQSDKSYNSFIDFNIGELNLANNFSKGFGNGGNNIGKNSNTVKFSTCSGSGTPNKVNSTYYSFNSKHNKSLSFNSKKSNFNDLNEFSNFFTQEKFNEENSMNAYFNFNSNLSNENSVSINTNKKQEKTKNLKKSFFRNLSKESAEELKIIGKNIVDDIKQNKENESKGVRKNLNTLSSTDAINYLNELEIINHCNHKTISFLKYSYLDMPQNPPISGNHNHYDNFLYKYFDDLNLLYRNNHINMSLLEARSNIEKTSLYNKNNFNINKQNCELNSISGCAFFKLKNEEFINSIYN